MNYVLPLVSYVAYASVTDDDDRRQRASLVWSSYTVWRRVSNNTVTSAGIKTVLRQTEQWVVHVDTLLPCTFEQTPRPTDIHHHSAA